MREFNGQYGNVLPVFLLTHPNPMNIKLKLFVSLREYLPAEYTKQDSIMLDIDDDETPYGLIDRFNIPHEMAHLVMINGIYVVPEDRDKPVFKEGDVLAIWPPVAGG